MNIEYLNTLPEVPNKFDFVLEGGEKVVFNAKLSVSGNEKDEPMGYDGTKLTVTNKRILVCNGPGIWSVDIAEDVAACEYVKKRFLFIPTSYVSLTLNKEVECRDGSGNPYMITGFHYYFKHNAGSKFQAIMDQVLK